MSITLLIEMSTNHYLSDMNPQRHDHEACALLCFIAILYTKIAVIFLPSFDDLQVTLNMTKMFPKTRFLHYKPESLICSYQAALLPAIASCSGWLAFNTAFGCFDRKWPWSGSGKPPSRATLTAPTTWRSATSPASRQVEGSTPDPLIYESDELKRYSKDSRVDMVMGKGRLLHFPRML